MGWGEESGPACCRPRVCNTLPRSRSGVPYSITQADGPRDVGSRFIFGRWGHYLSRSEEIAKVQQSTTKEVESNAAPNPFLSARRAFFFPLSRASQIDCGRDN